MWSHGTGSEVMQRIAAPMIGGMITAPLLSLFVIPAACRVLRRRSAWDRAVATSVGEACGLDTKLLIVDGGRQRAQGVVHGVRRGSSDQAIQRMGPPSPLKRISTA